MVYITQIDPPKTLEDESELVLDAVLFDEGDDPFDKQTGVVIFEDDSVWLDIITSAFKLDSLAKLCER